MQIILYPHSKFKIRHRRSEIMYSSKDNISGRTHRRTRRGQNTRNIRAKIHVVIFVQTHLIFGLSLDNIRARDFSPPPPLPQTKLVPYAYGRTISCPSIPGGPIKTEQSIQSFFTLLDRASFPHYNNTKIVKFG